MNRAVQYLNLIGVIALAALCVVQWQRNRDLNHEVNRLEKRHLEEAQKLKEQEKSHHGLSMDLTVLKEQISQTHSNLTEIRTNLRKAEKENTQLLLERNHLRESVTNWAGAVAVRDERLKETGQQVVSLSEQLNESIRKYNTLASNYNLVVSQLNEAQKQLENAAARLAATNAAAAK